MDTGFFFGMFFTLLLIALLSMWSGKTVKKADDFSTGGNDSGAFVVAGGLMGTLVGGASTVGTAQLAFTYGFSAIWFTLGGAIGCLILGLLFAKPMRASGCNTMQQVISEEYGITAGFLTSILSILGTFLSLVSQVLSASVLISSLTGLSPMVCALLSIFLMILYVFFGGAKGTGIVGLAKTILLTLAALLGGALTLKLSGGMGVLYNILPHGQYFSLIARGVGTDIGAGLSLVLGVLSTQAYAQCILSAKSSSAAIKGSALAALLTPLIGAGGVLIGMYMRISMPEITASEAFPQFVLIHMPGVIGGIVLATLLVTVVGTGAGLSLSISSVVWNDLLRKLREQKATIDGLLISRVIVLAILLLAMLCTVGELQTIILQWSFMSMALRGAVVFMPLTTALFFPRKISKTWAIASIICGPSVVLLGNLFIKPPFDPLFLGVACNVLLMLLGCVHNSRKD